ncbi:GAF and ANTAR domain-containing protein [Kribbella sp. NPDC050459]|uniref:GAF and ANTAR domain-containing protein n=1 Tax=Kribbella sp. NPDC050459 TaxID=3155785 RepID=UPI0033D0294B
MELPELADLMTTVADTLRTPVTAEDSLDLITSSVAASIPGITGASISVTSTDGTIETLAPTDPLAAEVDQLQYDLGEGPCLDAALSEPVVQVDNLGTDDRWPQYGPKAAALGMHSQLSFQFRAAPRVRGALNLYADKPQAFDADAHYIAGMYADWAAVLLGWSRQESTMTEALESRTTIGTAIGILMERYQLDANRAFTFLVRTSQTGNVKLREVAAGVVRDTAKKART